MGEDEGVGVVEVAVLTERIVDMLRGGLGILALLTKPTRNREGWAWAWVHVKVGGVAAPTSAGVLATKGASGMSGTVSLVRVLL